MTLTSSQFTQFFEALRDGYNYARLGRTLYMRLGKKIEDVSLGEDLQQVTFDLLRDAEMNNYVGKLVIAARQSNPDNAKLLAFAQDLGLSASTSAMERQVSTLPFVDVAQWRARLGCVEMRVCRVETATDYGTGFLVGPRTVLTNYHVVEEVIKGSQKPTDVVLRFDYKRGTDGTTLHPGTEFRLATDWLIDSSPYSTVDDVDDPLLIPGAEELDYALLRVDGDPGSIPVSATSAEPGAPVRGFVQVPAGTVAITNDQPILIVQHPKGDPLKLAFDTRAVTMVNGNRTRVRYRVNTEGGSSGSPVFDVNWNLLAIHHWGDPDFKPMTLARWNQGVPIDTIAALIRSRGHGVELG
jgi:V8-like Glu-specific endopeptidase